MVSMGTQLQLNEKDIDSLLVLLRHASNDSLANLDIGAHDAQCALQLLQEYLWDHGRQYARMQGHNIKNLAEICHKLAHNAIKCKQDSTRHCSSGVMQLAVTCLLTLGTIGHGSEFADICKTAEISSSMIALFDVSAHASSTCPISFATTFLQFVTVLDNMDREWWNPMVRALCDVLFVFLLRLHHHFDGFYHIPDAGPLRRIQCADIFADLAKEKAVDVDSFPVESTDDVEKLGIAIVWCISALFCKAERKEVFSHLAESGCLALLLIAMSDGCNRAVFDAAVTSSCCSSDTPSLIATLVECIHEYPVATTSLLFPLQSWLARGLPTGHLCYCSRMASPSISEVVATASLLGVIAQLLCAELMTPISRHLSGVEVAKVVCGPDPALPPSCQASAIALSEAVHQLSVASDPPLWWDFFAVFSGCLLNGDVPPVRTSGIRLWLPLADVLLNETPKYEATGVIARALLPAASVTAQAGMEEMDLMSILLIKCIAAAVRAGSDVAEWLSEHTAGSPLLQMDWEVASTHVLAARDECQKVVNDLKLCAPLTPQLGVFLFPTKVAKSTVSSPPAAGVKRPRPNGDKEHGFYLEDE